MDIYEAAKRMKLEIYLKTGANANIAYVTGRRSFSRRSGHISNIIIAMHSYPYGSVLQHVTSVINFKTNFFIAYIYVCRRLNVYLCVILLLFRQ